MSDLRVSDADEYVVPAALGPGDDHPNSPAAFVGEPSARAPLSPGESSAPNPDEDFHILVPAALGPGDTAMRRVLTRIPKG